METTPVQRRADLLLDEGLDLVALGNFAEAGKRFKASAFRFPSADAYTYWAWMEHQLGNTSFAITLCLRAIEIDPEFGNPYNDIGSYLISLGQWEEAVPWLKKAMGATRYEPKHYPHLNLGKVYLNQGMYSLALKEFEKALEYSPEDPEIKKLVSEMLTLH